SHHRAEWCHAGQLSHPSKPVRLASKSHSRDPNVRYRELRWLGRMVRAQLITLDLTGPSPTRDRC
ncbi:MAG: hypothetical protein ACRDTT_09465, partial [Pseudonocardiaceae bacterium]